MSFFQPDNLCTVTNGQWLHCMTRSVDLIGIGTDSRCDLNERVFLALHGPNHNGHDFLQAAIDAGSTLLIIDQDVERTKLPNDVGVLKVEDTRQALAHMAQRYRRTLSNTTIIAVTGSVGKTTTKNLTDAVLSTTMTGYASPRSYNNDIGVPLTILSAQPQDQYLVVEIGTNSPGEIAQLASLVEPNIAVITAIGRAHLEGLDTIDAVVMEKQSLLDYLQDDGLVVINEEAAELCDPDKLPDSVIRYGFHGDADLRITDYSRCGGGVYFQVNNSQLYPLGLPGRHNALNALAAVTVAKQFNVDDQNIQIALAQAQPAPARMEIKQLNDVTVYDDSYNANPESVTAALETFCELTSEAPGRIIVLGDMLELGTSSEALHRALVSELISLDRRCPLAHVVLVGEQVQYVAEGLAEVWPTKQYAHYPCMSEKIAQHISHLCRPNYAILLKGSHGMELENLLQWWSDTAMVQNGV